MAADSSYEQIWKKLLVYAPECPIPIVQDSVNSAYSRALARETWSGLRKQSEFVIPAPYTTGTVTVTQNSTTVTGAGTAWTSALVNHQFFLAGAPFYTVGTVTSTTTLELDRVYAGATASGQTYSIQYLYLRCPSDFESFTSVVDYTENWRLWLDITQEKLNAWDAQRTESGSPWILAPAPRASDDTVRYEIWPRPSAARQLSFWYTKKPALLNANSDKPIFPIRGDVLRWGALAEIALWPGTSTSPNPYFNLELYRTYSKRFEDEIAKIALEDQNTMQTNVSYDDVQGLPFAPIDASYLQRHDFI